jgi:hypothetical protein
VLHATHNKLQALPPELAACSQLLELEASHNGIAAIPDALAALPALQSLRLDSNRVKAVPPALLTGCTSLRALALHDNPITADQLRRWARGGRCWGRRAAAPASWAPAAGRPAARACSIGARTGAGAALTQAVPVPILLLLLMRAARLALRRTRHGGARAATSS